jgi:hypothetical protein
MKPYYATDRRVYDGVLCSDMRREFEHSLKLAMKLRSLGGICTDFPVEQAYMVFVDCKPLTDCFHSRKQEALIEAILLLESNQEKRQ